MATVASSQPSNAADIFASIGVSKSSSKPANTSVTAEMENRFLTLLTTQIKNQDPLNPLDNAQVTSQLAQINTVNGIEKLNASLNKLLAAYDASQAMQTAGMIGKGVLVPGNGLQFDGTLAAGGLTLDRAADSVVINILDNGGALVSSENLGARAAGTFSFVWDGKKEDGTTAPVGNYHISIEAIQGGEKLNAKALQLGTVNAVTRNGNGFVLDLGALGVVPFEQVQQII